mgnify:CR=1 FL=1
MLRSFRFWAGVAISALFIGLHNLMGQSLTSEATPQVLAMKVLFGAAANVVLGAALFWVLDRVFPEQSRRGQMRVQRRFERRRRPAAHRLCAVQVRH